MFGVWRSCQHFAVGGARPDATSQSLETIIAASAEIEEYRNRWRFVAELRGDEWVPIGFFKNGQRKTTSDAQLTKYTRVRSGAIRWSNDYYEPLTDGDHPQRTIDLDAEGSP